MTKSVMKSPLHLFDEYKSYKYDLAYIYANRFLHLAEKLHNRECMAETNGGVISCQSSSGLFKDFFDVASRIDITDVSLFKTSI